MQLQIVFFLNHGPTVNEHLFDEGSWFTKIKKGPSGDGTFPFFRQRFLQGGSKNDRYKWGYKYYNPYQWLKNG